MKKMTYAVRIDGIGEVTSGKTWAEAVQTASAYRHKFSFPEEKVQVLMDCQMGNSFIRKDTEGIRIAGYIGTWHVIDVRTCPVQVALHGGRGIRAFLLEHSTYGDETESLIVDAHGNLLMEDVWNGFSELF